jgi:hypothetical protein
MSERTGSYVGVIVFAVILGVLAYFQFRTGNIVEDILAVAAVLFCLGLLAKQRWARVGVCITLLVAIAVYFTQSWLQPIVDADPGRILPNVIKLVVALLLFIYIGRERVEAHF